MRSGRPTITSRSWAATRGGVRTSSGSRATTRAGNRAGSGRPAIPPTPRAGTDFLGKPLDMADGVFKCLFCHATNPRAVLEQSGPESLDRAIGCEHCHGPGGDHIKAILAKFPDPAIINPAEAPAEGRLRLCGQCHSHHQESSLPRTDPFWIRFEGTTLPWSRCYTESDGSMDCMTCHDPHHDNDRSEAHYTARCLTCHASSPPAEAKESRGKSTTRSDRAVRPTCPINSTKGCVGCHMPPFRECAASCHLHRSLHPGASRRQGPDFQVDPRDRVASEPVHRDDPRTRLLRGGPAGQGPGCGVPLADQVAGIGGEVRISVDAARRPAHVDAFGLSRRTQAVMEPRVAGRLEAAPSEPRGDPDSAVAVDRDDGADGVAVRGGALQAEGEEMAARRSGYGTRRPARSGRRPRRRAGRRCRGRRRPVRGPCGGPGTGRRPASWRLLACPGHRSGRAGRASSRGTGGGRRGRARWR